MADERAHVKAALEAAQVQLKQAIGRVDTASGPELSQLKQGARVAAAFVDFNSGCGKGALASHQLLENLAD